MEPKILEALKRLVGEEQALALAAQVDGVNRRVEQVVTELDGRKSLYSTAFYDRETFWSIYGGDEYSRLKSLYDPQRRLRGLYEKVVERQ